MNWFGSIIASAVALGLSVAGTAQSATFTQSLNIYTNGGSPGVTVGSVTVTDLVGGGVSVDATLLTGFKFVNTGGPHSFFAFNVNPQVPLANFSSISPGIASALLTSQATPFGSFSNGIDCTSCANGAPGAFTGPITFDLSGISTASFVNNSTGYMFAADILNVDNGVTGSIAGSPGRTTVQVPEPATLALYGAVLLGLGAARRRRARAV